jgi:monoterpene epsilon-lactone hydrolase
MADQGGAGVELPSGGNVLPDSAIEVPARKIPIPLSISEQARLALRTIMATAVPSLPSLGDIEGWRAYIGEREEVALLRLNRLETERPVTVEVRQVAHGVDVHVIEPGVSEQPPMEPVRGTYLFLHGGALITGRGRISRAYGALASAAIGLKTWAVDYRTPPDHPYPAALDDCVASYRALLDEEDARRVIVGGESAGGNLAAAMVLRARDEGLPLPAAIVLLSPELDLTESGDTFRTNLGVDRLSSLMVPNLLYANGKVLSDPYLSPLFGDFSMGFPPTFIQSGTRDLFLSNAVRMHRALRKAGVLAELHVFEAMPHIRFAGSPEEAELEAEVQRFAHDCLVRQ